MWKWFKNCKTAEQGKQLYRELAKKYHPDNGGTGVELREIIEEFKNWFKSHKDIHTDKTGNTYESEKKSAETPEKFIQIVNNLLHLGIDIEICGTWLWLEGNTYPAKEQLKELGCRWSKSKRRWYWTQEEYQHTKSYKSMNSIRRAYGSEHIYHEDKLALE